MYPVFENNEHVLFIVGLVDSEDAFTSKFIDYAYQHEFDYSMPV